MYMLEISCHCSFMKITNFIFIFIEQDISLLSFGKIASFRKRTISIKLFLKCTLKIFETHLVTMHMLDRDLVNIYS